MTQFDLFVFLSILVHSTLSQTCTVVYGTAVVGVGERSYASCDTDYTLVGCGLVGTQSIAGTYIDPSNPIQCIAEADHSGWSVTAVARCCSLNEVSPVLGSAVVEGSEGTESTAMCPSGTYLTGCQVLETSGSIDTIIGSGSGSGSPETQALEWVDTNNQCNAYAKTTGTVKATALCLTLSPGYELSCVTKSIWASTNSFGGCGDDLGDEYFMTSCNAFITSGATIDGWRITDAAECYVQQDSHVSQYANAICCKYSSESCSDEPCDTNALCTDTDSSVECECNDGYAGDGFSCSSVYVVGPSFVTFDAAKTYCEGEGMRLARIDTEAQWIVAKQACDDGLTAVSAVEDYGCYIGVKDVDEGYWYWYEGDDVCPTAGSYGFNSVNAATTGINPWYTSEPNNAGLAEDCVHIWPVQGLDYNDITCSDKNLPLCESYEADTTNQCDDDSLNDCDDNAICVDTNVICTGGYDCECNDGYTGDGFSTGSACTNIDECTTGDYVCPTGSTCNDVDGSYECLCDPDLFTFDWDYLTEHGDDSTGLGRQIPDHYLETFTVHQTSTDIELEIQVRLETVFLSSADDQSTAKFPVTYILDFEDFDVHKSAIHEPGTCENRDAGGSWSDYWTHSDSLDINDIGSSYTGLYPLSSAWTIDEYDCSNVVYSATFTWEDLRGCTSYSGDPSSYTSVVLNDIDNTIDLKGVFYVNVVSPYWYTSDMGYYRVYQIISQPFIISVSRRVDVIGAAGINVMTICIIAVYKEGSDTTEANNKIGEDVFKLVVLTETTDYMQLTDASFESYEAFESNDYAMDMSSISSISESSSGCLNNKNYICSQLWEIRADNIRCSTDESEVISGGVDFSGHYGISFTPECISGGDDETHCTTWLADHYDEIGAGVTLWTQLTWRDDICSTEEFDVTFNSEMTFYADSTFGDEVDDNFLFAVGTDEIFVQINTFFPSSTFDVFSVKLEQVWICEFSVDDSEELKALIEVNEFDVGSLEEDGTLDSLGAGCLSTSIDGIIKTPHMYDYDYPGDSKYSFDLIDSGISDDSGVSYSSSDVVQFSFIVPDEVQRDTLFIHAILNVELSELSGYRRRVLLREPSSGAGGTSDANQINSHFDQIKIKTKNNNNIYNKEQPPPQKQPQPIHGSPSLPNINNGYLSLSSPWIIAIASLLAIILTFNILMMCYMNCNKESGRRLSFNRNRRSGYNSVKHIDSEDFNESEANAINVVSE